MSETTNDDVRQFREMAAQVLSPGSKGKALFERAANALEKLQAYKEALEVAKVALEKSIWQHRCSDGIGGCTAISESFRQDALATINEVLK